ncbi:MAG: hypothetical protein V1913_06550 [Fibrobacterota bacterium]
MGECFSLPGLREQSERLGRAADTDWALFPASDVQRMADKVRRVSEFVEQVNQRLVHEVGPRIKRVNDSLSELKKNRMNA